MRKSPAVQGTFSKLFGRKHASPAGASLYAANPPWIFAQEAPDEGPRGFDGIYYGDGRFNTVSECGTATLKARPRVRPLLTFLPLNAQENHGLAVPTPSVPEDFADKEVTGPLVNGNLRLYSSVGDLRPGHYGLDPLIPPPPPGPAPRPPVDLDASPPGGESPPPPPPPTAPPPPPLLLEPPSPPSVAPPTPPALGAAAPGPALPSPSTPTPPDFIPPAPPLAIPEPPPLPAPGPPASVSPRAAGTRPFPLGGVTKWKSEVALNGRQPEGPGGSPPRSPAELKGSPKPDPHLTFPRSPKVPPPTPVRTSSIPVPETQDSPQEEEGGPRQASSRLPLPPSFHIRAAAHAPSDSTPKSAGPGESQEPRAADPASPRKGEPPAPAPPPPAPPLPPPAPPLPAAAPESLPKTPKSSSPAPKLKPRPPSPEHTAAPVAPEAGSWDPGQMEKLRSELAAYLCGRDQRPGPPKDPPTPRTGPPPGPPEREASPGPALPPVDYAPQDPPAPSVRQIRSELEARLSSAERDAKPGPGALPPKPRLDGGRSPERRPEGGRLSRPAGAATPAAPRSASPPKAAPLPSTPPWRTAEKTPGAAAGHWKKPVLLDSTEAEERPSETPAAPLPASPPKAALLPSTPPWRTAEKTPGAAAGHWKKPALLDSAEAEERPPENPAASRSASPPKAAPLPSTPPWRTVEKTPGAAAGHWKKPVLLNSAEAEERPPETLSSPALPPKKQAGLSQPPRGPLDSARRQAPPQDEVLRHPVTGEVVERGSPMALLLAARQRAQKGRPGGSALGRSSLPGSLRGPSSGPPEASDSIFYSQGRPNSFTVVPKASAPWRPPAPRDADGWTQERPAAARGHPPPKSFSSPPSPSRRGGDSDDDDEAEESEFGFGLIPPPPEFCSEPAPPPRAVRGSPPRPGGLAALSGRAGARERGSGTGRSLIKKRLYVGEPPRPAPPRGATARSLSTPNCFGPPPAGPEMRRVHSAGRAAPGGLHARRMSLEGAARGEPRGPAAGAGDFGYAPGPARTPHSTPHYGNPINTFTVRPGTRHPISYAYSGTHRKSMS